MTLVKFPSPSDDDLFRCIEFYKRYQNMIDASPSSGNIQVSSISKKTMYRIKKSLDLASYTQFKSKDPIFIIGELERRFNLRIDIYTRFSTLEKKRIVKKNYESSNTNGKIAINLFNSNFNKFSNPVVKGMALIIDLKTFLSNNGYNSVNNLPQWERMTFFQAVTSELKPKITGQAFFDEVKKNEVSWNAPGFHVTRDKKKLHTKFKLGLQMWVIKKTERNLESKKVLEPVYKNRIVLAVSKFSLDLVLKTDDLVTYYRDSSAINYFACENERCKFGTNNLRNFRKHSAACASDTVINCAQKVYGRVIDTIKMELVSEGIIPSQTWECQYFCTFDIETGMARMDGEAFDQLFLVHKLLSIGITSNFGTETEFFLLRKDMQPESLKILVADFVSVLQGLRNELFKVVPVQISDGLSKYIEIVDTAEFKRLDVHEKSHIYKKISYLREIFKLKCYSWNGGNNLNIILKP